jgi:hypothetical protein
MGEREVGETGFVSEVAKDQRGILWSSVSEFSDLLKMNSCFACILPENLV